MLLRPLEDLRILVVDDDADARSLATFLLEVRGAQVVALSSVADGLEHVAAEPVDLLVSDIAMPVMDGLHFIRKIRASSHVSGLPAVALTAFESGADWDRVLAAGFDAHVAKSAAADDLVDTIRSLLDRPTWPRPQRRTHMPRPTPRISAYRARRPHDERG